MNQPDANRQDFVSIGATTPTKRTRFVVRMPSLRRTAPIYDARRRRIVLASGESCATPIVSIAKLQACSADPAGATPLPTVRTP